MEAKGDFSYKLSDGISELCCKYEIQKYGLEVEISDMAIFIDTEQGEMSTTEDLMSKDQVHFYSVFLERAILKKWRDEEGILIPDYNDYMIAMAELNKKGE